MQTAKHVLKGAIVTLLYGIITFGAYASEIGYIDSLKTSLGNCRDSLSKVDIILRISEEYMRSDYPRAVRYANRALAIIKTTDSIELRLSTYRRVAYVHYYNSSYGEAMAFLLRKLKLADSIHNLRAKAWVYNIMGNIYYYVGDYQKARDYCELCLPPFKELNDSVGVGYMYTNLGNYYESERNFERANHFYLKALETQQGLNNLREQVVIYNNLGNLYYKHKGSAIAKDYFIKALEGLPLVSEPSTHALVYINAGDFFLWEGDYQRAAQYLYECYQLAQKHKFAQFTRDAAKSLGKLYALQGQFEKAYRFKEEFEYFSDSLQKINNASKISFLDFTYQNERIEFQQQVQRHELKRKARVRAYLLAGVIAVALCVIITIGVVFRSHKRKEALKSERLGLEKDYLQKQLDLKNKEIVIKTMNLFERNELIRQVVDRLRAVTPDVKRTCQVEIESIVGDLRAKYQENVMAEFEMRFKQVYDNFYTKIKEEHPCLTSNDLRLCAFLKMQLTSKDIAAITHLPLNTVQMARKRLRKKLGFENSEVDLEEYIAKF